MRNKQIVYYDMDGVLADFAGPVQKLLPGIALGKGDNYEERSRMVKEACIAQPRIFLNLPALPDAIESVLEVMEHYEVYFLSTPMEEIPDSFGDKFLWLKQHFGDKASKRLILSAQKDLNIGDYLIDDTTRNGADNFTGTHIHFGTADFPNHKAVSDYLLASYHFKYAA